MRPVVFRMLDAHVIAGRADAIAVDLGETRLTYAQLLHETAALAAGLRALSLAPGDSLALAELEPGEELLAVLASARLGVYLADEAQWQVHGSPAMVRTHTAETIDLHSVLVAGRGDPLAAPHSDPDGLEQALRQRHIHIVETLLSGATLESA